MNEIEVAGVTKITLKPSYLILSRVSRAGGVSFKHSNESEEIVEDRAVKEWQVQRSIPSVKELKRANNTVAYLRRQLEKSCYKMGSALVCAKENRPAFDAAVKLVHDTVLQTNLALEHCKLYASFVVAEIVTDDQEAAVALKQDISELAAKLDTAIKAADVKAIRQTIQDMKGLESLVPEVQSEKLKAAVKVAKQFAHAIVIQAEKKGQEIEEVKAEIDLSPIDEFRFAFLEQDIAPADVPVPVAGEDVVEAPDLEIGAAATVEDSPVVNSFKQFVKANAQNLADKVNSPEFEQQMKAQLAALGGLPGGQTADEFIADMRKRAAEELQQVSS